MELLGTIYGELSIIFLLELAWFVLVARGTSIVSQGYPIKFPSISDKVLFFF